MSIETRRIEIRVPKTKFETVILVPEGLSLASLHATLPWSFEGDGVTFRLLDTTAVRSGVTVATSHYRSVRTVQIATALNLTPDPFRISGRIRPGRWTEVGSDLVYVIHEEEYA